MDRYLADLAHALFDCGAFKDYRQSENQEGFKLDIHKTKPTTPLSPFRIDLRPADHPTEPGTITPTILEVIGQELYRKASASRIVYEDFVGLPDTGASLALAFDKAQDPKKKKRILTLEKNSPPGQRFTAELKGNYDHKDRVLLIDGLISSDTTSEATGLLRGKERLVVEHCVVLIDHRPRTLRRQSIAGLRIHAVFLIEELIVCYITSGMMPQAVAARILNYLDTA